MPVDGVAVTPVPTGAEDGRIENWDDLTPAHQNAMLLDQFAGMKLLVDEQVGQAFNSTQG